MQLNQIKTFLEVCQTRHFGRAAENLNVTTSAVSTRIRLLEESLKTKLFVRLHNEVRLTEAGQRLIPYCRNMIRTWEQARFSAIVESDPRPNLTVLASPGVWESIDSNWIKRLVNNGADLRLRLETAYSAQVFSRLEQGTADFALVMEQHTGVALRSVKVCDIELVMVSDQPGRTVVDVMRTDYIHVDWGTSFGTRFLEIFPDYLHANITVSTAKIAADLLLDFPGAAYLSPHLIARIEPFVTLHRVADAPTFEVPIYAYCAGSSAKSDCIDMALACFAQG